MVRETRYLWVWNLPEKITETRIKEHFERYGKIQTVNVQPDKDDGRTAGAVVAFMDIKSAAKAHNSENVVDGLSVQTGYNEPTAAIVASSVASARTPEADTSVTSRELRTSAYTQRAAGGRYPARTEGVHVGYRLRCCQLVGILCRRCHFVCSSILDLLCFFRLG
ncbi:hypothetical protein NP493_65g07045 [Ridgeia piscesae]|uniref:RRM domain-containing protein n=1 Tax=Ridgeia piscesae TaxID=27915 RepID=A0AAD9PA33_RIDPI|nr:hypothetical protein NP493_65g07045 [Ridgeia piscesae]